MNLRLFIKVVAAFLVTFVKSEEPWVFLVMTDWHAAEFYSHSPVFGEPGDGDTLYASQRLCLQDIHNQYGGELIIIPGDLNGGKWSRQKWIDKFSPNTSPQEAVFKAGTNCYKTVKNLFSQSGYDKILVGIGDHELGDNYWGSEVWDTKTQCLRDYRASFVESFHMENGVEDNPFSMRYKYKDDKIGTADITPYGTDQEYTSFAHKHKNVLFVTIDAFVIVSEDDFMDRENGLGGEGIMTGDVIGPHLKWFEDILKEARKDDTIKHIIVQSHLPILQPVRRAKSSSMFFDRAENSEFWKIMVQYEVDVYFAGEVHAFTASKTPNSNLVQIVSKSKLLENFLKVVVTEDSLRIDAINDARLIKPWPKETYEEKDYETIGSLVIDKSSTDIHITDSGVLKILDVSAGPLIHFPFDQLHKIEDRQIFGFQTKKEIRPFDAIMKDKHLHKAIQNEGLFGQQFDSHVGNITVNGGVTGSSGFFDGSTSEMGVWAYGPQIGGSVVSYSVWFNTWKGSEMILIHCGPAWEEETGKNMFTLTLDNGVPTLYASKTSVLRPINSIDTSLNDSGWHNVVVSMTHHSSLLSEVLIFIDGKRVLTSVTGDVNLFFVNHSQISVGSFGYTATTKLEFPSWNTFHGSIDEAQVWGKTIREEDLKFVFQKEFKTRENRKCYGKTRKGLQLKVLVRMYWTQQDCRLECLKDMICLGYEVKQVSKQKVRCTLFQHLKPKMREDKEKTKFICASVR